MTPTSINSVKITGTTPIRNFTSIDFCLQLIQTPAQEETMMMLKAQQQQQEKEVKADKEMRLTEKTNCEGWIYTTDFVGLPLKNGRRHDVLVNI